MMQLTIQFAMLFTVLFANTQQVEVGFGGFKAYADLESILSGEWAKGGLKVGASTPFGQSAVAGLGGSTGDKAHGRLYAGATAGNGVSAGAGLAGSTTGERHAFAGASAGAHTVAEKSKSSNEIAQDSMLSSNIEKTSIYARNGFETKAHDETVHGDYDENREPTKFSTKGQVTYSAKNAQVAADALQIPIAVLQAVNQFLGSLGSQRSSYHVQKSFQVSGQ